MKLRKPEDRIKGLNGEFTIEKVTESLGKAILTLPKDFGDKIRWFHWFDRLAISEIEAKHEVLKVFAMETENRDLLNINSTGVYNGVKKNRPTNERADISKQQG